MQTFMSRGAGSALVIILLLALSVFSPGIALSQSAPSALPAQEERIAAAVEKAAPSVVSIIISKDLPVYRIAYIDPFGGDPFFAGTGFRIPVYQRTGEVKRQRIGAGSGFIATADGYVVTNRHVVADRDAFYTAVLSDGTEKEAVVAYRDLEKDLALVKIDGVHSPVTLGRSSELRAGQSVIAIGNALGEFPNTVSVGIVSGLNRSIEAVDPVGNSTEVLENVIQTDAALSPGSSGGPLIALDGSVVGVNVAMVSGAGDISFALPSEDARTMLRTALERSF